MEVMWSVGFLEGGKPRKKPSEQGKNNATTNATDIWHQAGIKPCMVRLVGGQRSHHCTIPVPQN